MCCAVLCCAVPCCAVLWCAALDWIGLCCVVLCCVVLWCAVLNICCDALLLCCVILLALCCDPLCHVVPSASVVLSFLSCRYCVVSYDAAKWGWGCALCYVLIMFCFVLFALLCCMCITLCCMVFWVWSWFLLRLVCPYRQRKWTAIQTSIPDTYYLFNLKRLSKTVGNGISNSKVIQSTSSDTAQFSSRM